VSSSSYTNWNGKSGYIGFTFKISGNTHYGWFYATVTNDGLSYTILDYAYNTNPNQGLTTKRPAAAGPEKVENLVKIYPNSFTETTNIDLTKLGKERFTMSVYDLLGRLIYHKNYDKNPGVLPFGETITEKGNYFVKIRSKGTSEIHTIVKR
ncbi:T9SS type A sorting domain-containing protein, partial [Aquimarina macrocephali]|uniref:T9SS type A sorting domain-containing protein n=1 Tax=Aquimarina macrocephali TaxID=666563 RepID=UPI000552B06C